MHTEHCLLKVFWQQNRLFDHCKIETAWATSLRFLQLSTVSSYVKMKVKDRQFSSAEEFLRFRDNNCVKILQEKWQMGFNDWFRRKERLTACDENYFENFIKLCCKTYLLPLSRWGHPRNAIHYELLKSNVNLNLFRLSTNSLTRDNK